MISLRNHSVQFVAIRQWPGEHTKSRSRSQFKANYSQTCELLDRELRHLRAKHVVIQLDCEASQIRQDGLPRVDARMRSPGIILSFESRFGPLSYPCDRFSDWKDNLRAIALSLEALRSVDRYGVTRRAEQYRGWKAITFRGDAEFASADEAAAFLARHYPPPGCAPSLLLQDIEACRRAYKHAAAANHPDRGGDPAVFSRITAAWEILRAYHERRKLA